MTRGNVVEMRQGVTVSTAASDSSSAGTYLGSNMALAGLKLPVGSGSFAANTARLKIYTAFTEDGSTPASYDEPVDYSGTALDEATITVAQNNTYEYVYLTADKWDAFNWIKIYFYESDGTTAVTQTSAVDITAIVRPY